MSKKQSGYQKNIKMLPSYRNQFLLLLIFALVFGACSHAPYQESLTATEESVDECPNISGSYWNYPNWPKFDPPPGPGFLGLSDILEPGKEKELSRATHVEIRQHGNESFEVIFWSRKEFVAQKTYQGGGDYFECNGGMIQLDKTWKVYTEFASLIPYFERYYLAGKDHDGFLIVIKKIGGAGIGHFIIPIAGREFKWIRYLPKTKDGGVRP